MPNHIDLVAANVSHAGMKLSKNPMSVSKLAFVTIALLVVALPAAAQRSNPGRQSPRQNPNGQASSADVQVWVGIDVLPGGVTGLGSAGYFPAPSSQDAQLAGIWTTEAMPGLVLTLQPNGDFALATPVNPERRCAAGTERGSWFASADAAELLFHIKTDTSGRCGFSDLEVTMEVVKSESGLNLITHDPAAGEQQIPLNQAAP